MAVNEPVVIGIIAVLVLGFFLLYLFLRRIATDFRDGLEEGRGGP